MPSATDPTAEQVIITIMTVRILWFVNVVSVQLIIRLNICAEMLYIFDLTLFFYFKLNIRVDKSEVQTVVSTSF